MVKVAESYRRGAGGSPAGLGPPRDTAPGPTPTQRPEFQVLARGCTACSVLTPSLTPSLACPTQGQESRGLTWARGQHQPAGTGEGSADPGRGKGPDPATAARTAWPGARSRRALAPRTSPPHGAGRVERAPRSCCAPSWHQHRAPVLRRGGREISGQIRTKGPHGSCSPHLWPPLCGNKGGAVPASQHGLRRMLGGSFSLPCSQGTFGRCPCSPRPPSPCQPPGRCWMPLQTPPQPGGSGGSVRTMMTRRMFWNSLRKPRV